MKDFTKNIETPNEASLTNQETNHKPKFSTRQAAICAYEMALQVHAKRCGRTISDLLNKAEHSAEFDEEAEEAMSLWRTLSSLKSRG